FQVGLSLRPPLAARLSVAPPRHRTCRFQPGGPIHSSGPRILFGTGDRAIGRATALVSRRRLSTGPRRHHLGDEAVAIWRTILFPAHSRASENPLSSEHTGPPLPPGRAECGSRLNIIMR